MLHLHMIMLFISIVECQWYTGTKGHVWPAPRFEEKEKNVFYTLDPSTFKVHTVLHNCMTLMKAVKRVLVYVKTLNGISSRLQRKYSGDPVSFIKNTTTLSGLSIELTEPCERYPYFNMDENYTLLVSQSSLLTSSSIWGVIRGLETFSQLFFVTQENGVVVIQGTHISDSPRYAHRGLLLDTARHYIPPHKIQLILDAMAMNKLNVFHWHIVDDQSFPYRSEKFPEMSEKGAFHPALVYTKENIEDIVEHARARGIRVIPEIDIPGHSRSWGASHPEILVKCPGAGLMHPIRQETHELLKHLLQEVQDSFPDQYFHLGADEVNHTCWYENADIEKFMMRNNYVNTKQLLGLFMKKAASYLKAGTVPIVWQDFFQANKASLLSTPDIAVQVWKQPNAIAETIKLLNSGHRVIFSSYWYLDHLDETFKDMYSDPRKQVLKQADVGTMSMLDIIGGEVCMWTEMVDDTNVISVIWPRASAAAEILWSEEPQYYTYERRIEEHVCRMRTRGIPIPPPNGPGFCIVDVHSTFKDYDYE